MLVSRRTENMHIEIVYFHELNDSRYQRLVEQNVTWDRVNEHHPQPKWCDYPHALSPIGCNSLTGRLVTGEDYCKDCPCYKENGNV